MRKTSEYRLRLLPEQGASEILHGFLHVVRDAHDRSANRLGHRAVSRGKCPSRASKAIECGAPTSTAWHMEASSAITEDERNLISWLEGEPEASISDDLVAFSARLQGGGQGRAAPVSAAVLEAGAARVLDMAERMRAQLLAVQLPVPTDLYETTDRMCVALLDVAGWFAERVGPEGRRVAEFGAYCLSGLELLTELYLLSNLVAAPVPAGVWRLAHRLAREADVVAAAADDAVRCAYLRLVSIATSQPEGLTGRELAWAVEFLDARVLGVAGFDAAPPENGAASWWIDASADLAPQAVARRPAPDERVPATQPWSFNPRPMAQKLGECVEWITAQMTAAELAGTQCDVEPLASDDGGFPAGLSALETLALLRRLRSQWMVTPVREQPRRQNQYVVQVCIGLGMVWELGLHRGQHGQHGRAEPGQLQEWVVLNESPGGLAIMSVAGAKANVEAGAALALRRDPQQPWSVCIVRWVRSEMPGQVELGLQLIGVSFQSVRVGFRGRAAQQMAPALALPVMEPVRRHPAMLTPAGTYASRRFVFVRDGNGVYVAQARALGLDMQTPGVELFQYEIDPYPI